MPLPRLRQFVLAAASLKTADQLAEILGLGEPFEDPGVKQFGLVNRVYAIGDQFLEVVVPVKEDAPAGRFLQRNGDGGYMVIVQVKSMEEARAAADEAGFRRVWNIDLDDISASHLHPTDVGGAILSFDQPVPPPSWRWGGPDWRGRSVPGTLRGVVLESPDPDSLTDRWGIATGAEESEDGLVLDTADIVFVEGEREGILAVLLELQDTDGALARAEAAGLEVEDGAFEFCGIFFDLTPDA